MRKLQCIAIGIICLFTLNAFASNPSQTTQGLTDAHLHYVDFLQKSDGINALLSAMDKAGVENILITGLPLIKKWDPADPIQPVYYLDNDSRTYYYSLTDEIVARAVKSLPINSQKRFHPFICGFNPTDKNALDHIKQMIEWYPNFWKGIGEVITRHGALTALTEGETATADNKALYPVYDYAGNHHLPVLIHSDISTPWVKQNSASAQQPIYLSEIEEAIKTHPKTTFIWAHAGLDRDINVPNIPSLVDNLLTKYQNLYIDIAGFSLPYLMPNGKPDLTWVHLINKYPNRFFLGTDTVGHFSDYPDKINSYKNFLDSLSPDVAKKVSTTNFLSILPKYHDN